MADLSIHKTSGSDAESRLNETGEHRDWRDAVHFCACIGATALAHTDSAVPRNCPKM